MSTYASGETPMVADIVQCVHQHPIRNSILKGNQYVVKTLFQESAIQGNTRSHPMLFVGFEFDDQAQWSASRFRLIRRANPIEGKS